MTTRLPTVFLHKMNELLQDEFPSFLASYDKLRAFGVRRNPLKIEAAAFAELVPFGSEAVPWAEEGYYLNEGDRPGKHPYYHAGLYYIQEPSAMAPVELLDVKPGDKVLDLCGAPGGKSTQIAGKLKQQGCVVANDNHPDRVKAMVKNLELFGVTNAVVVNDLPERLAKPFADYFDKILVDAPCSGEGMFRKEPEMSKAWSESEVSRYASMQHHILDSAAKMLKPGGRMVYSTCTFSPEENEASIARFLEEHPHFRVIPTSHTFGFAAGRPDWLMKNQEAQGVTPFSDDALKATQGTIRLWPHLLRGEGHYVAVLERDVQPETEGSFSNDQQLIAASSRPVNAEQRAGKNGKNESMSKLAKMSKPSKSSKSSSSATPSGAASSGVSLLACLEKFWVEHFQIALDGPLELRGEYVYKVPVELPDLSGIKVVKPGWFLGSVHHGRFEPSQALAMGLQPGECLRTVKLAGASTDALRYLKGETLHLADSALVRANDSVAAKGYTLVTLDGYPVGWAKWQDGMLKNEYPAGWRWT